MASAVRSVWWSRLALAVAVATIPAILCGAGRADKASKAEPAESVEMFSAIEQGQIKVRLIPKDSTQCRVMIENKTDKPLSVKLPDAFAGVPVLAQVGGIGGAGGGGSSRSSSTGGGNQSFGGGGMGGMGMGGGMMGGMGGGMGGGMFNVPPEKTGQYNVTTVCLDHGKREPRANMAYEIKPIEKHVDKPAVQELIRMLGRGELNQRAAQAAAWHLNNNMSWEQLAAKQLRFANGTSRPYFAAEEIRAAMQISMVAANLAEQRQKAEPSSSVSQNSAN